MTQQLRPAPKFVPVPLLRAALTVGCLLVLTLGAYLALEALVIVTPVTMAVVVALLLAALIGPGAQWLRARGLPGWLVALLGVLGLLATLVGALTLVGFRAVAQARDLRQQVAAGVQRLRELLTSGPIPITDQQLDRFSSNLLHTMRHILPSPLAGAAGAAEVAASAVLMVILLFFSLRDGPQMWCWLVGLLPPDRRSRTDRAMRAGWHTLTSYTRGIVVIAAVDATGIGIALFALDVPPGCCWTSSAPPGVPPWCWGSTPAGIERHCTSESAICPGN